MRVGILGATGFVGKNLTSYLSAINIDFVGCSRSLGVDVTDIENLKSWLSDNKITHVVNLAAECGGIGLNMVKSADLWRSTQLISSSVLEACSASKIFRLVNVGSICSYPRICQIPFREEYLMTGWPEETNRAYGMAKLNALIGAVAYHKQYGLNVCNLLPTNMYGRHDNFDSNSSHVIPNLIKKSLDALANNRTVEVWGTGNASRDFLHVYDFCNAVHLALTGTDHRLNNGDFINIGTNTEITIKEVVETIIKCVGKFDYYFNSNKPDGQPRRCVDITRAREILGYEPTIVLESGIKDTIKWFNRQ